MKQQYDWRYKPISFSKSRLNYSTSPLKTVSRRTTRSSIGGWEIDFLARLRIRRGRHDHDRAEILIELNEITNVAQHIMVAAHPQNQRLLILCGEVLELERLEDFDMELERSIWARAR
ncbi:hypothetical protein N7489_005706 [Penicillium chrysogenum]|uniref:Uncharacterized protein n=1 Tax=Penicillium chrysogenum TaxID=5076 RepID=A0ABQ8WNQ2_PENCH|nr:uncharacterized protein N7489_005706 [Penicillium chrysogenum]KAJ5245610.1 hypothetical protein N7489_005706 [Penicillium chrysogenum]KAJ5274298.1 hypothetical protein N7505_002843 [Penicillium chrysogenum]KAJ5284762.1 hypothetical protein N7524_000068 [Penicillium chrysogenum]KAJ6156009.1 hypothetical protein N7497_004894 [Penicillium chrysogenum]